MDVSARSAGLLQRGQAVLNRHGLACEMHTAVRTRVIYIRRTASSTPPDDGGERSSAWSASTSNSEGTAADGADANNMRRRRARHHVIVITLIVAVRPNIGLPAPIAARLTRSTGCPSPRRLIAVRRHFLGGPCFPQAGRPKGDPIPKRAHATRIRVNRGLS